MCWINKLIEMTMKNFQQTPKQKRVVIANHKAAMANSRKPWIAPREAWGSKLRIAGVPINLLHDKQNPYTNNPTYGYFGFGSFWY